MTLKAGQRVEWQGRAYVLKGDVEAEAAQAPPPAADGFQRLFPDGVAHIPPNITVPPGTLVELEDCQGFRYLGKYHSMENSFYNEKGVMLRNAFKGWRWPVREPKKPRADRRRRTH